MLYGEVQGCCITILLHQKILKSYFSQPNRRLGCDIYLRAQPNPSGWVVRAQNKFTTTQQHNSYTQHCSTTATHNTAAQQLHTTLQHNSYTQHCSTTATHNTAAQQLHSYTATAHSYSYTATHSYTQLHTTLQHNSYTHKHNSYTQLQLTATHNTAHTTAAQQLHNYTQHCSTTATQLQHCSSQLHNAQHSYTATLHS